MFAKLRIPLWLQAVIWVLLGGIVIAIVAALVGGVKAYFDKKQADADSEKYLREAEAEARRQAAFRDVGVEPPKTPGGGLKQDIIDVRKEVDLDECRACMAEQPLWGLSIFKPPEHWAKYNARCSPIQKDCAKANMPFKVWSVDKLIDP